MIFKREKLLAKFYKINFSLHSINLMKKISKEKKEAQKREVEKLEEEAKKAFEPQ